MLIFLQAFDTRVGLTGCRRNVYTVRSELLPTQPRSADYTKARPLYRVCIISEDGYN